MYSMLEDNNLVTLFLYFPSLTCLWPLERSLGGFHVGVRLFTTTLGTRQSRVEGSPRAWVQSWTSILGMGVNVMKRTIILREC